MNELNKIEGIGKITVTGTAGESTEFKIEPDEVADLAAEISRTMMLNGWLITELHTDTLSLEDIFLRMINEPPKA